MSKSCSCNVALGNTGKPNCQPIAKVTRMLIAVPLVANDGTENVIDLSVDTLDQAYFDAKINESDDSKRWYPLGNLDNVEDVRNDPQFFTVNSGQNFYVQQGTRTFAAAMVNQSPEFQDKLNNYKCTKFGFYLVELGGNLIGNGATKDILKPIRVDEGTFYTMLVKATDTDKQLVMVNFEWHRSECDEDLRMIVSANIDAQLLDLQGLLDVEGEVVGTPTTAAAVVKLTTCFGSFDDLDVVEGLVLADFEVFNKTQSAVEPLSGVVESPAGTYELTYTSAVTSGDVLEVRIIKTNSGLDDTKLRELDVVTP